MSKFCAEFGNTCIAQNIELRLPVKQELDNMDLLQFKVLQQVNDQSNQQCVSWCTHCLVWGRGTLTVGM